MSNIPSNILSNTGATSSWAVTSLLDGDRTIRRSTSAENIFQFRPFVMQCPQVSTENDYQNNTMESQYMNCYPLYYYGNAVYSSAYPFIYGTLSSTMFQQMQGINNLHISRNYMTRSRSDDSIFRKSQPNERDLKILSKRYWEQVNKYDEKPGFQFKLMSYNVLAQDLIEQHLYLYKYHNQKTLEWKIRWRNLYEEISKILPDIMCLQEVQESHLTDYYNKFEFLGYKGLYKKRTGMTTDGCAIFYQADKVNLVEYETVEFFQPYVGVLNRDNVAIIAKFSPKNQPENEFIVATTHLLYNPKRTDVRLAQTQLLVAEIERLSFSRSQKSDQYLPIIITGDFNTKPDSAVYEYITRGVLTYKHLGERCLDHSNTTRHGKVLVPKELEITDNSQHAILVKKRDDKETISRTEESALIKLHNSEKTVQKTTEEVVKNSELFCSGTISHLFALRSVYDHGHHENSEGSTYHDEWISVDYIFYSGKREGREIKDHRLELLSRYRLPRKSELGSMKIPNKILGSDHLCLVANFKLNF
ncbi:protein angel homolog 2 [Sitophilus oryzae]|uniref:Protein angel homolog 2 n=1 Tax=Sitophilus oryzae TaxID=7048 RepID=A0A6J2X8L8_SITOR|nr:protein angel homolog 2 [Sitophilus oryzae]